MYWQPFAGSLANRVADLETNQTTQQSTISALTAALQSVFGVAGRGSIAATSVANAVRVRLPLPVVSEALPPDGRWNRQANGVIAYDGSLGGLYVVSCAISFQTSLAVLTRYSFILQEGTNLAASEVGVRDTLTGSLERSLAGTSTTTAICIGPLSLQNTGGELALRVEHTGAASLTLTPSDVQYFLHRIDTLPIP